MKKNEIKVVINIDKGIDKYNNDNPEKRKITRQDIYNTEGITKSTIQNWYKGKVPKALTVVFKFLQRTGLKLEDIIEAYDKDGNKIF